MVEENCLVKRQRLQERFVEQGCWVPLRTVTFMPTILAGIGKAGKKSLFPAYGISHALRSEVFIRHWGFRFSALGLVKGNSPSNQVDGKR